MYKYVVPSTCSVGDFRHLKACHQEIAATKPLIRSTEDYERVKDAMATVHFLILIVLHVPHFTMTLPEE